MLDAVGTNDLVSLYGNYWFRVLLNDYDTNYDQAINSIMFGKIDNIIAKTN